MKNCMSIENQVFGYKRMYTIVFSMNDLNVLNRILTVKIEVKDRLVYQ